MKKTLIMFCMAMSLFATNVFAQEVHGVSTRRVVYESDNLYNADNGGKSGKYYGWEVTNNNSIKISVDIILNCKGREYVSNFNAGTVANGVVTTKSIVLKPGESYIFKREDHCSTHVDEQCPYMEGGRWTIDDYYIEYKAYKLQ